MSLLAMPPVNLPPIAPRKEDPSDRTADHLRRCMKSVQELALTISCALDTLRGHEKTGSSDIHGTYAELRRAMAQLPRHVQCDQCKQSVAWSDFEPARSGIGQSRACKCRNSQHASGACMPSQPISIAPNAQAYPPIPTSTFSARLVPSASLGVAVPLSARQATQPTISARRGSIMPGSFPDPPSESALSESSESEDYRDQPVRRERRYHSRRELSRRRERGPQFFDTIFHSERGKEFSHKAVTGSEAQARLRPQTSDATSLPTISSPSSHPLDTERVARSQRHQSRETDPWGASGAIWSFAPPSKSTKNDNDNEDDHDNDNSSSGNKPTRSSNEPGPSRKAVTRPPAYRGSCRSTSYLGPQQSEPVAPQSDLIPVIAQPDITHRNKPKQARTKGSSAVRQTPKEKCRKMRKRVPTNPEGGSKNSHKSTSCVPEDDLSDDRDRYIGGNQQRQPLPDKNEHLDSVSGAVPDGGMIDLDMDLDDSVGNDPLPEDQTSQHRTTQRPLSPRDYQALLDGQHRRRPLTAREGQDDSAAPLACDACRRKHVKCDNTTPATVCGRCSTNALTCTYTASRRGLARRSRRTAGTGGRASTSSARDQATRPLSSRASFGKGMIRRKVCRSDQDEPILEVSCHRHPEKNLADANFKKMADGKEGHTDTTMASGPEQPATPAPIESPFGSGHLADETFEPIEDSSDYNAERYFDVGHNGLDNFNFDHLIDDNDQVFPSCVDGLGDGGYQDHHTPQLRLDTENVPQHGQKRSHSGAFQGSLEHTALSQRPPRRNKACEPLSQADDPPADNDNNESSTENLSGVQALLLRWFDANSTDVLLRPSDD